LRSGISDTSVPATREQAHALTHLEVLHSALRRGNRSLVVKPDDDLFARPYCSTVP
jgi:hypothetical protein